MISKKRIKERLLDICNGAGMGWTQEGCWEFRDDHFRCIGRMIIGIERAFALPLDNRLRNPWCLEGCNNIDRLTDLVDDAIKFDKE